MLHSGYIFLKRKTVHCAVNSANFRLRRYYTIEAQRLWYSYNNFIIIPPKNYKAGRMSIDTLSSPFRRWTCTCYSGWTLPYCREANVTIVPYVRSNIKRRRRKFLGVLSPTERFSFKKSVGHCNVPEARKLCAFMKWKPKTQRIVF